MGQAQSQNSAAAAVVGNGNDNQTVAENFNRGGQAVHESGAVDMKANGGVQHGSVREPVTYDPSNAGFAAQYGASIHNEGLANLRADVRSSLSGESNSGFAQTVSPLKQENEALRRQYHLVRAALGQLQNQNVPSQYDHMRIKAENAEIKSKLESAKSALGCI